MSRRRTCSSSQTKKVSTKTKRDT